MEVKLVVLAMIHKDGKVLIGKRKTKDEYVERLTWVFPGGDVESLDFENELKKIVREETNLEINIKKLVFVRKVPEAKIDLVLFYFDCIPISENERGGGDLLELKWVPGTAVTEYFTTSVVDRVMEFLREVEDKRL